MKKKLSAYDAFMALSDEEKAREVAQFDEEFSFEKGRPLSPANRARWERAKRKPPRPAATPQVISLTLESDLLKRADARAKARRISRARLITEALEAALTPKKRRSA